MNPDRAEVLAPRWSRIWDSMRELGLASIVLHGRGVIGAYGPITYLTGRIPGPKGELAIIRLDEEPVSVFDSDADLNAALAEAPWLAGECAREHEDALGAAARLLGPGSGDSIGYVSSDRAGWPRDHWSRLELLCGDRLVAYSDAFAALRRSKSHADVAAMRRAVALAEECLVDFQRGFRPGMSEREGAALLGQRLLAGGGSIPLLFVSCNRFLGDRPGPRRLVEGDLVSATVEFAAEDGSWVELGALFCSGRHSSASADMAQDMIEVLRDAESSLAVGRSLGASAAQVLREIDVRGWVPVEGLGHGTGIDEEWPSLSPAVLHAPSRDDLLAVHPSLSAPDGGLSVSVANVVRVGEHGSEPLSVFPHQVHAIA